MVENEKDVFVDTISKATDLSDHLQDLTDYLKRFTNASAVYIGKLVAPKKRIRDDDDDTAHIDNDGDKIIHFSHSNEEHAFIVDTTLSKDNGLTFDVFKAKEVPEPVEGEEVKEKADEDPDHILIKEVVREPRIHFFTVPRLGSYLAIKLEYKSCLSVEAYNAGIQDAMSVRERLVQQEEERRNHDEAERDRKEECEANDQVYERREFEGPDIKPKPFQTHNIQYVVCINTLGQDREFTAEQIRLALDTVKFYRDEWERIERNNISRDI